MLSALYNYAIQQGLTLPPGFVYKPIKAYVSLGKDGSFLGIMPGGEESVLCPDIGSLANGTDKSNVLAEKCSVVFAEADNPKNIFFRKALRDGGKTEPMLLICLQALETPETLEAIRNDVERAKIKGLDRISFRVDGKSILKSEAVRSWWAEYREQFIRKSKSGAQSLCLITGKETMPVATVPTITGLSVVGGHSKGDALICFDKAAFCSYGLKQSANAPVSEEAFFAVKAALDQLLKKAPILCGMKFVHWYDQPIRQPENEEKDKAFDEVFGDESDEKEEDDREEADPITAMIEGRKQADQLIARVKEGGEGLPLPSVYTVLLLSGVNGRVMVRRYEHGSYDTLQKNLKKWNDDLQLVQPGGSGELRPCKLAGRMTRLLKKQKSDSNIFERMGKELAGIEPVVLMAILNGSPLPDSIAVRALGYIRSQMLETDENADAQRARSVPMPDARACQWLKAWLVRKRREVQKEEHLMKSYNPQYPGNAYHCGALMSVFANLQMRALGEVGASVVERYYASAIQMPGLVLGKLSALANYHLDKLNNRTVRNHFVETLSEIAANIKGSIPATLNLAEQSEFALGYYQMQADENKWAKQRTGSAEPLMETVENDENKGA